MTLIKIGHKYINLDNVCDIHDNSREVSLYFNVTKGSMGVDTANEGTWEQVCISLRGEEATELRRYLDRVAVDVTAPPQCTCDECQKGYR